MAIPATSPTTVSATYDLWAFTFTTSGMGLVEAGQAPSEAAPIAAFATLRKYRQRADGAYEASPSPADTITISVDDIYALAATDADVAAALSALDTAVHKIAAARGVL